MISAVQKVEERGRINQLIRTFFVERGYVEVETPILGQSPGMEPNLTPFETLVRTPSGKAYPAGLITSPEYAMKKLLGEGMKKIFTITKVFRNEEALGGEHNPEFSMLEWYQQGADYHACMDETEALVRMVVEAFDQELSSIERVRVRDLFFEATQVDLDQASKEHLVDTCKRLGIRTDASDTESDVFYRLFLAKIEPMFHERNIFVYDYPSYQAALAALTPDERYGQRFELYLNGLELCNGFTELTDSEEQRRRFEEEAREREGAGKRVFPIDEELLRLLPSLQTPTFGNALGIDRLHMIATQRTQIEEVLPFPARKLFT